MPTAQENTDKHLDNIACLGVTQILADVKNGYLYEISKTDATKIFKSKFIHLADVYLPSTKREYTLVGHLATVVAKYEILLLQVGRPAEDDNSPMVGN